MGRSRRRRCRRPLPAPGSPSARSSRGRQSRAWSRAPRSRVVLGRSCQHRAAPGGYFKPITCALASNPVVSNTFTVDRHATYDRSLKAWHLPVAIPGPGTVSAIEPEPTIGTAASHAAATTSPLIQVRKVGLTSSGKVTLTLRLTSHGQQIVAAKGSVRPKLDVSFAPKGGKPSSQLITLTLQRSVTEEGRMLESAWIPATRAFGEFSSWTGRGPRRGG